MYRAKGTFNTGKQNFQRGKIYTEIPEGYEGHFDKMEQVKEEKKVSGKVVETASKRRKKETR